MIWEETPLFLETPIQPRKPENEHRTSKWNPVRGGEFLIPPFSGSMLVFEGGSYYWYGSNHPIINIHSIIWYRLCIFHALDTQLLFDGTLFDSHCLRVITVFFLFFVFTFFFVENMDTLPIGRNMFGISSNNLFGK